MDCPAFRRQHLEFLDQTLPRDLMAAMESHAGSCGNCDRFDTTLRRGLLVAWNLARIEPRPDFLERLHSRIEIPRHATPRLAAS
jgi:hypothetical protein